MSKDEFAKIAMAIRTYYPREKFLPNVQAMELWYNELKDLDYETMNVGVRKWVSTHEFSPSIAKLREMCATVERGEIPGSEEGWEEVRRSFSSFGQYNEKKALESFSPITRRVVEIIGYKELCWSENQIADRRHFMDIYDQIAHRMEEDRQIAPSVQARIAEIRKEHPMLDLSKQFEEAKARTRQFLIGEGNLNGD